jgi:GTPase SAR1 family protein
VEEVRTERGSDVIIMLVGNKTDLVDKRYVFDACLNHIGLKRPLFVGYFTASPLRLFLFVQIMEISSCCPIQQLFNIWY